MNDPQAVYLRYQRYPGSASHERRVPGLPAVSRAAPPAGTLTTSMEAKDLCELVTSTVIQPDLL